MLITPDGFHPSSGVLFTTRQKLANYGENIVQQLASLNNSSANNGVLTHPFSSLHEPEFCRCFWDSSNGISVTRIHCVGLLNSHAKGGHATESYCTDPAHFLLSESTIRFNTSRFDLHNCYCDSVDTCRTFAKLPFLATRYTRTVDQLNMDSIYGQGRLSPHFGYLGRNCRLNPTGTALLRGSRASSRQRPFSAIRSPIVLKKANKPPLLKASLDERMLHGDVLRSSAATSESQNFNDKSNQWHGPKLPIEDRRIQCPERRADQPARIPTKILW